MPRNPDLGGRGTGALAVALAAFSQRCERERPPSHEADSGDTMRSTAPQEPVLVNPVDLDASAGALCRRFGEATAEAYRLTSLHEVLERSRALARALDDFAQRASAHYRGVHSTTGVQSEIDMLSRTLAAWSQTVLTAGGAYRAWQQEDDSTAAPAAPATPHDVLGGDVALTMTPLPA
jgi:hypothetical protein